MKLGGVRLSRLKFHIPSFTSMQNHHPFSKTCPCWASRTRSQAFARPCSQRSVVSALVRLRSEVVKEAFGQLEEGNATDEAKDFAFSTLTKRSFLGNLSFGIMLVILFGLQKPVNIEVMKSDVKQEMHMISVPFPPVPGAHDGGLWEFDSQECLTGHPLGKGFLT